MNSVSLDACPASEERPVGWRRLRVVSAYWIVAVARNSLGRGGVILRRATNFPDGSVELLDMLQLTRNRSASSTRPVRWMVPVEAHPSVSPSGSVGILLSNALSANRQRTGAARGGETATQGWRYTMKLPVSTAFNLYSTLGPDRRRICRAPRGHGLACVSCWPASSDGRLRKRGIAGQSPSRCVIGTSICVQKLKGITRRRKSGSFIRRQGTPGSRRSPPRPAANARNGSHCRAGAAASPE